MLTTRQAERWKRMTLVTGVASGMMLAIGAAVVFLFLLSLARSEITTGELICVGSMHSAGFVYTVLG